MALKVTKEMIADNLPFTAKMAWKLAPEDQKDKIVVMINAQLAKGSDDASIDQFGDQMAAKFPAFKAYVGPATAALKKAIKNQK
jgi:hypothetical protein